MSHIYEPKPTVLNPRSRSVPGAQRCTKFIQLPSSIALLGESQVVKISLSHLDISTFITVHQAKYSKHIVRRYCVHFHQFKLLSARVFIHVHLHSISRVRPTPFFYSTFLPRTSFPQPHTPHISNLILFNTISTMTNTNNPLKRSAPSNEVKSTSFKKIKVTNTGGEIKKLSKIAEAAHNKFAAVTGASSPVSKAKPQCLSSPVTHVSSKTADRKVAAATDSSSSGVPKTANQGRSKPASQVSCSNVDAHGTTSITGRKARPSPANILMFLEEHKMQLRKTWESLRKAGEGEQGGIIKTAQQDLRSMILKLDRQIKVMDDAFKPALPTNATEPSKATSPSTSKATTVANAMKVTKPKPAPPGKMAKHLAPEKEKKRY